MTLDFSGYTVKKPITAIVLLFWMFDKKNINDETYENNVYGRAEPCGSSEV